MSKDRTTHKAKSGLRGLFGNLFGGAQPVEAKVPAKDFRDDEHWVGMSLDDMIANDPDLTIHMISLKSYRAALGETWDRVEGKIMVLADATIRHSTGGSATITRHGADLFLLAFPKVAPEIAVRRTGQAAITLGQKLVGAKFKITDSGDAPALCVASLPASKLIGDDGKLDQAAIAAMADSAAPVGQTAVSAKPSGPERKAAKEPDLVTIERHKTATDPRLVKMERPSGQRGEIELVPIRREPRPEAREVRLVPLRGDETPRRKSAAPEWVPMTKR